MSNNNVKSKMTSFLRKSQSNGKMTIDGAQVLKIKKIILFNKNENTTAPSLVIFLSESILIHQKCGLF